MGLISTALFGSLAACFGRDSRQSGTELGRCTKEQRKQPQITAGSRYSPPSCSHDNTSGTSRQGHAAPDGAFDALAGPLRTELPASADTYTSHAACLPSKNCREPWDAHPSRLRVSTSFSDAQRMTCVSANRDATLFHAATAKGTVASSSREASYHRGPYNQRPSGSPYSLSREGSGQCASLQQYSTTSNSSEARGVSDFGSSPRASPPASSRANTVGPMHYSFSKHNMPALAAASFGSVLEVNDDSSSCRGPLPRHRAGGAPGTPAASHPSVVMDRPALVTSNLVPDIYSTASSLPASLVDPSLASSAAAMPVVANEYKSGLRFYSREPAFIMNTSQSSLCSTPRCSHTQLLSSSSLAQQDRLLRHMTDEDYLHFMSLSDGESEEVITNMMLFTSRQMSEAPTLADVRGAFPMSDGNMQGYRHVGQVPTSRHRGISSRTYSESQVCSAPSSMHEQHLVSSHSIMCTTPLADSLLQRTRTPRTGRIRSTATSFTNC